MLKKSAKKLLIILIILSPVWMGSLPTRNDSPEEIGGLVVFIAMVVGVPVIILTGLIATFMTRKLKYSGSASILGFAVPATIICSWEILALTS